ncbi:MULTISPECIES: penicillin-binding protein 2 [unclassified Lentimonas]|uniref:peptidoglycan D,D-transpeptidase FtsI family protein n=1 Tax=unclassified Lentimonas TaxID=2630993 RepID=UPI0013226CFC|nr:MULTISPECIES: penicillin-binding transpeptidase domain-containing protein [unclassified Lentimonas]CAA6680009.1 Cell division protein FtsI [Peptidoglycan synthetase] (EC [Lentimonas sp. CC4]CAA6686565.1 Cell division protein FtsI [Peptidoglycan synthetase] (EC [Lentimonas sp. CC6]CAA7074841.1 Cell division protein FtsI [Peptidoglycan synthetase] (EC [Lentimonas sp. CC4]CAA7169468.1 Cell division protein FtsI [Peptidoglycan synthetase] (EC [Lentimonas sp. CC21]CAA7183242.1 Cell division prot
MSQYDVHKGENPRILLFLWIVLAASAVLIGGLGWSQLIDIREYKEIEKRQTERRILTPGPRGDIYDRDGNLLVGNRPHYSAVAYLDDLRSDFRKEYSKIYNAERARIKEEYENTPEDERPHDPPTPNYNKCAWTARLNVVNRYIDIINRITGRDDSITESKLIRHFNEKLLLPLPLVEDLSPDQYARLVEQIPVNSPIQIHTGTARYYPYKSAAAHLLGYVQNTLPDASEIPDDGIKTFTFKTKLGKTGLERSFNDLLSGKTGMEMWRVDPLGFQDTRLEMIPPEQGENLITSIDMDLQLAAETGLGDRTGAAIALDIQSGEVLTLVSHPTYDLNDLSPFIPRTTFEEINERGAWLNRALQLSYPPGSTFKLITSIAGMRNGTIDGNTKHNCQGVHRVGNRVFRCNSRWGHGQTDLPAAIEKSCNVFYYAEGLRMGIDVLSAEAKRFGLDQKTGVEVPFETSRVVVPSKEWKREKVGSGWVPGDTANTAIGQGFLLQTPLQMATVIASIARGETRTKPTLKALTREEAMQVNHGGESIGLTPEQTHLLWEGMERVVGPNGTGRLVQIDHFRIGGKTGTADFRAHGKEVNLAWFFGFAPMDNPQIAVAVMVEGTDESHGYHGGSTAGPVAKDIFLKFIEKYPERAGFPTASEQSDTDILSVSSE